MSKTVHSISTKTKKLSKYSKSGNKLRSLTKTTYRWLNHSKMSQINAEGRVNNSVKIAKW